MLGHGDATTGNDKCRGGRDVERAAVITARAAGVHDGLADWLHVDGATAHGRAAPASSSMVSPLVAWTRETRRSAPRTIASQNGVHNFRRFVGSQVLASDQVGECCFKNHLRELRGSSIRIRQ